PLGVLGSLATFGGIWKSSIVPDARGELALSLLLAAVMVAGVVGLLRRGRLLDLPVRHLTALALLSLAVAALPAVEVGRPVVEWVVVQAPGGGIVRDSQKLLMPWVLVVALGFGLVVSRLAELEPRFGRHVHVWSVLPVV